MANRNVWLAITIMLAAIGVHAQPAESLSSSAASDATFRLGAGDVLQITRAFTICALRKISGLP